MQNPSFRTQPKNKLAPKTPNTIRDTRTTASDHASPRISSEDENVKTDPRCLESTQILSARLIAMNKQGGRAKFKFGSGPITTRKPMVPKTSVFASECAQGIHNSLSHRISHMMGSQPLQIKNKFSEGASPIEDQKFDFCPSRTNLRDSRREKQIGFSKPTFKHIGPKKLPEIEIPTMSVTSAGIDLFRGRREDSSSTSLPSQNQLYMRRLSESLTSDRSSSCSQSQEYSDSLSSSGDLPSLEVRSLKILLESDLFNNKIQESIVIDRQVITTGTPACPINKKFFTSMVTYNKLPELKKTINEIAEKRDGQVSILDDSGNIEEQVSTGSMTNSLCLVLEKVMDFAEENQLEFVTFDHLKDLVMPEGGKANFGQYCRIREIQNRLDRLSSNLTSIAEFDDSRD